MNNTLGRKDFIDNLRWLTVLWLIPYHAACVFRPYNLRDFYVRAPKGGEAVYEILVYASYPWMMTLLFVIAGVSAYYALNKRGPGDFAKERFKRLVIPLSLCTLLLSPLQSYIGELVHSQRTLFDPYWKSLKHFLSTGFSSGYTGGFCFNGFWFVRYLFWMCILSIPVMVWFKKKGQKVEEYIGKLSLVWICALFIFPAEALLLKVDDYSFKEYLAFFLLGFFVLSNEEVQEKVRKWRWVLVAVAVAMAIPNIYLRFVTHQDKGVVYWSLYRLLRWVSVLALFGMGKQYLNRRNRFTDYMTQNSYGIYMLHQTILVLAAYSIVRKFGHKKAFSEHELYFMLVGITFVATFVLNEILRRIPGLRWIIGAKKPIKKKKAVPVAAAVSAENSDSNDAPPPEQ